MKAIVLARGEVELAEVSSTHSTGKTASISNYLAARCSVSNRYAIMSSPKSGTVPSNVSYFPSSFFSFVSIKTLSAK